MAKKVTKASKAKGRTSEARKEEERGKAYRESVLASLDNSFKFGDVVGSKIDERIRTRVSKTREVKEKARKAFRKFSPSRLSPQVRADMTYLADGDDLGRAQEEIVRSDLVRMSQADKKSGISIKVSTTDLQELELELSDDGMISGTVPAGKLMNHINNKMRGTELYANLRVVTQCKIEKDAKEIMEEATGSGAGGGGEEGGQPSGGPETGGPAASDISLDQLVKDNVAVQMKLATSPEERVIFGAKSGRANEKDITDATNKFELRGGPADVTAYHNFHDLQIAFRHVWTELFDKKLVKQGERVFAELAKCRDDYNAGAITDDTVNSVDQLKELMDDLRTVRFEIAGADIRYKELKQYLLPELSAEQWGKIDAASRAALYGLVQELKDMSDGWAKLVIENVPFVQNLKAKARKMLEAALAKASKKLRVEDFLEDLEERLKEKYAFDVFATDPKGERACVNYGILVQYRQKWEPLNYQVGELVSTMPLAPKEVRKYSTRRVVKKSRAEKEVENSLQIKKEDSSSTRRDHAEIVSRATNKTNFQHNASGGVNFEVWNAKASYAIGIEAMKQSSQVKKLFREAVLKAAQEYRNERKLEISTAESTEFEETTSGEISNPNDEIPVTYLFYELQRVYEISEKIHKLTPVILMANEVPYPNEVDEDWLLAHDWILRRVILDDSFLPALDYLSDSFVGDEISSEVHRNNFETQLGVVEKISQQVGRHSKALEDAQKAMDEAIEAYAGSQAKESEGLFEWVGEALFGGDEDLTETHRIKMEAAKEAFQRAERRDKELRARLESEVSALDSATDKYSSALEEQFNRRSEILRLRSHVKDNILYYMQAIWDQEPPDQRFFRLYNLKVPDIKLVPGFVFTKSTTFGLGQQTGQLGIAAIKLEVTTNVSIGEKKLVEVADLDNLLGYKGNYMIFPLKENNVMTLYMMQDYIDIQEMARLVDPDEAGSYTIDEIKELIECYAKKEPQEFEQAKGKLRDMLIKRLMDPVKDKDIVVVPTDSLYIEALPGKHPILEDFKLVHRAIDIKKVQSEVRHGELENVRLAARALKGEYEDPDIEKKIVIEGGGADVNVPATE